MSKLEFKPLLQEIIILHQPRQIFRTKFVVFITYHYSNFWFHVATIHKTNGVPLFPKASSWRAVLNSRQGMVLRYHS